MSRLRLGQDGSLGVAGISRIEGAVFVRRSEALTEDLLLNDSLDGVMRMRLYFERE